jgi:arginyl-tRNA synthetase
MGYAWAKNCMHLSYGMVDLPSGKMKSREGTVVDADDLMAEVVAAATEMTKERGHLDGMSDQEKENLYRQIGMGGLKYYLLKVDPKKRMMYNPEESIELNGNTGPFIQYAYARIQSLITKSDGEALSFDASKIVLNPEEKEIIKQLDQLPAVIDEAARELSPALIANYTFELVKTYNSFYQSVYILNEPAVDAKRMRLTLSKNVAKVIQLTMRSLGVEVPARM